MSNYFPSKDNDFANWLATFLTNATANLAALGLIAGDLTPISTLQTTYTNNLLDVDAKKAALASSVQVKDATKESIIYVADILPDGTIELDWSRNGKIRTMIFLIYLIKKEMPNLCIITFSLYHLDYINQIYYSSDILRRIKIHFP